MAQSRSLAASGRSSPCPNFLAKPRGARREARIEEAEGLAEAIGIDVVAAKPFRVRAPRPATLARQGPGRGDRRTGEGAGRGPSDRRCRADPDPAEESGGRGRNQGDRPHRLDPGDFRRARGHRGRAAAGRARAPRLPGGPPGSELDPPRAPARRLRLPRRPWRDPDRGRPPPDPRSDGEDSPRARPGEADARRCTATGASARLGRWSRSSAIPTPENLPFSIG